MFLAVFTGPGHNLAPFWDFFPLFVTMAVLMLEGVMVFGSELLKPGRLITVLGTGLSVMGLLMLEGLVTELGMGLSTIGLTMVVSKMMSVGSVTEMGLLEELGPKSSMLELGLSTAVFEAGVDVPMENVGADGLWDAGHAMTPASGHWI